MTSQKTGQAAEDKALVFLSQQGLKLVNRNYNCRMGELDLIMRDGADMVFIEVRLRTSMRFGGALASITHTKRQKIMKAAIHYMMYYRIIDKMPMRFDIVSIEGTSNELTWLKDAFGADY